MPWSASEPREFPQLVGVEMNGDAQVAAERVLARILDGRQVGHVTEMVWSPRLERNIGYVWVPTG